MAAEDEISRKAREAVEAAAQKLTDSAEIAQHEIELARERLEQAARKIADGK